MALVHRRTFLGASAAIAVAPNSARAQVRVANYTGWGTMTRTERDAAYNVVAAVSDSRRIVDGWVSASATLRSQRSKHIGLAYGPAERNKWDLFPGDNPQAPCLVFIHGGYWQGQSRESFFLHCGRCFGTRVVGRTARLHIDSCRDIDANCAGAAQFLGLASRAGQHAWHCGAYYSFGPFSGWASHCADAGPSKCKGGIGNSGDI
jgi:hypothetical protein